MDRLRHKSIDVPSHTPTSIHLYCIHPAHTSHLSSSLPSSCLPTISSPPHHPSPPSPPLPPSLSLYQPDFPPPCLLLSQVEPPLGGAPPAVPRFNLGDFDAMLSRAAASVGIRFEFRQIECRLESLTSSMLNQIPGEALLVNGALRFHTFPDESVVKSSPRDAALRAILALNPRILFLGERVVDQNIPFFMRRFTEVLDYYSAAFDSLDAGMPRDNTGRLTFEKNVLGRDITNAIACEGLQRVVRCEPVEKWEKRLKDAAFVGVPPGIDAMAEVHKLLTRKFHAGFQICQEKDTLFLTWKGKKMIASSSWRPAC